MTIDLYVNGVTGQDLPGRGLSSANPFATITYALQQLMHLRPTQEIVTIINVAPDTYNENLIITGDNIRVIKDESYVGNVIVDGEKNSVKQNVITIDGAHSVAIERVTI